MFGRKRKPLLTREQSLRTRPVRNPDLEVTRDDKGCVSVNIPRRKVWWIRLLAKMSHVPEHRVVSLDEVGTEVWDMCDGKNTAGEIIARFAELHQLSRKEAEVSMVSYLRELARRGMVMLMVPEVDRETEGAASREE